MTELLTKEKVLEELQATLGNLKKGCMDCQRVSKLLCGKHDRVLSQHIRNSYLEVCFKSESLSTFYMRRTG